MDALRPPAPKKYSALEAHNAYLESLVTAIEQGLGLASGSFHNPQQAALTCARLMRKESAEA